MTQSLRIGSLVRSTAGRDVGTHYIIVGFSETSNVLVANGLTRSLERPKRKNPRHVSCFRKGTADGLEEKILQGQVTNEEIARIVRNETNTGLPGEESEVIKPDVKEERCY